MSFHGVVCADLRTISSRQIQTLKRYLLKVLITFACGLVPRQKRNRKAPRELIARLATDQEKRKTFGRLARQLRAMAAEVKADIALYTVRAS